MRSYLFILIFFAFSCGSKPSGENSGDPAEPLSIDETEQDEVARLEKENEKLFAELGAYDGKYMLYTESEGAQGTLEMKYLGDKTFRFSLRLSVDSLCDGEVSDTAFVDRTQHAFFAGEGCLLHFNLLGKNIEIDEPEGCDAIKGDCTFAATYRFLEK